MAESHYLQEALYRSFPTRANSTVVRKFIAANEWALPFLPRVPGFFQKTGSTGKDYWTLAATAGLLIPVRNDAGQIISLLIRPDDQSKGQKYFVLSSKKHTGLVVGKHIHKPLWAGETSVVRLVEGPLKADVTTLLSGVLTVGLPGLCAKGLDQFLAHLTPARVLVALDADAEKNSNVARALKQIVAYLRTCGMTIALERWPLEKAKGIDDLLAVGLPAEVVDDPSAIDQHVAAVMESSGANKPHSSSGIGQSSDGRSSVPELPDDPHRLARIFLATRIRKEDGRLTLRYHCEEWLHWTEGAYRVVPATEIRGKLVTTIKKEFDRYAIAVAEIQARSDESQSDESQSENGASDKPKKKKPVFAAKVTNRLVSDAMQALASLCLLESQYQDPCWINEAAEKPAADPKDLLACRNGLINLANLVSNQHDAVLPATPDYFVRCAVDYQFRPDAPPPERWLGFLQEMLPNDPEAVSLLQEWFGYCLTPDTRQQKILLLIGSRRSGKGTISRVLKALIGAGNVCAPTLSGLGTNFGLWPLQAKTLALIGDARLSDNRNVAVEERLLSISGEDPITIDRKHRQPLTVQLPIRFVIVSNELPAFRDASGAMSGRLLLIRMPETVYGKEDPNLTTSLLQELPGILLWAIAGWARLRGRGHFVSPSSSRDLMGELEELASPAMAFIRDCCRLDPDSIVTVEAIHSAWKQWNITQGVPENQIPPRNIMGRDLMAACRLLKVKQTRTSDGSRRRTYHGIALREGIG